MITPLLFLLLAHSPRPAQAQGRAAAQAQTTQAPAAPAAPQAVPGGGRGRGGIAGPGPAIGGEIDETPVVTHHSITVDGKTINYTATVAQMPLKNASGETEAHIFYMAYTLDGAETCQAAADLLLQRRPRLGLHVGAHGRHGAAQSQAACPTAACLRRRIN